MKILAILLMVISGLVSGCIVAEPQYRGDRENVRGDRDRDRDGVPDRQDRRPDDPRRY
jgi:hypothetical protein